jgi:hypothetical protein
MALEVDQVHARHVAERLELSGAWTRSLLEPPFDVIEARSDMEADALVPVAPVRRQLLPVRVLHQPTIPRSFPPSD